MTEQKPAADDELMDDNSIIGSGTLHSLDAEVNMKIIRPRGIGFLADVDTRPVFRVPCASRKVRT